MEDEGVTCASLASLPMFSEHHGSLVKDISISSFSFSRGYFCSAEGVIRRVGSAFRLHGFKSQFLYIFIYFAGILRYMCWSWLAPAYKNWFFISLSKFIFSNVMWVAQNGPCLEYVRNGNWQILQIRNSFFLFFIFFSSLLFFPFPFFFPSPYHTPFLSLSFFIFFFRKASLLAHYRI